MGSAIDLVLMVEGHHSLGKELKAVPEKLTKLLKPWGTPLIFYLKHTHCNSLKKNDDCADSTVSSTARN